MVAQVFNNIAHSEIRVSWHDKTTGYVNGNKFEVVEGNITYPNHPTFNRSDVRPNTRHLVLCLSHAVRKCSEFSDASRESKSTNLTVVNGNFPGLFQVTNPLNGNIYNVVLNPEKTYCECPDHQYRGVECKHLRAVKKHQPTQKTIPTLMPSYAGKARSQGRIKSNPGMDITDEQLANARASLGI